jgi:type II secretory pathway predicted ATPase ExeA
VTPGGARAARAPLRARHCFADDAVARLPKLSLGLPRALNNAALITAATAGKALVDDDCAKKALAELTRD